MKKINKNKFIISSLALCLGFFCLSFKLIPSVAATGLSVGTSSLTLGAGENLFYGNIKSDSNAASNFLLFQKSATNSLFKVGSDGGGYFMGNVGIGTTSPQNSLLDIGSMYLWGGNGDLNNDGTTTAADAVLVQRYLLGLDTLTADKYAKADVNGDYRVDMLDAELIIRRANGTITDQEMHQDIGKRVKDLNFYVDYNGNVGIGWGASTSSPPLQRLSIFSGGDYSLDVGGSKIANVATGVTSTDAVNLGQVNTAIQTATSSLPSHNAVTLAAIGGGAPNANGMTLNTQVLNLEPANGTYGGVLTAAAQSIAGAKTFAALITGSAGLTITGAAVNLNASSNFPINIGTGNSNGAITIGNSANTLDLNPSTLSINTSDWDISATGTMTNISGISTDGGYTQSGTSANAFTGTATFSNATYAALFPNGPVGIGTSTPTIKLMVYNGGSGYTIDAGNSKVTNLAAAVTSTDATRLSDVQSWINAAFLATVTVTMNLGGNNIINIGKLTVGTIDPLYNIFGTNYSTYGSSIAGGVKEEYVGQFKINTYHPGYGYEGVIDFDNLKTGSDLWVWRHIVDFSPDNVQVFISPYGSFAQTYYLINDNKLIFRSDAPANISYRLVGNRFDWKSWPTKALNQKEPASLIIR